MDRFRELVSRRQGGVMGGASSKAGRIALAASLALVLGVGVAACGSSSDSSGGQINLVAYSTPETVYDKALIPGLPEDLGGRWGDVQELVRPLGRPAAGGDRRPAGRLRPPVDRARHAGARRRRDRRLGLGPEPVPRDRPGLGGGVRGPQGQPEGHQDLGRRGQARRRGRDPERVQLGRREVESAGRLRCADRRGQVPGGGAGVPEDAARARRRAAGEREATP